MFIVVVVIQYIYAHAYFVWLKSVVIVNLLKLMMLHYAHQCGADRGCLLSQTFSMFACVVVN